MQILYTVLNLLPAIGQMIVFVIGVYMITKNFKKGWLTPPVLSGISFVLLTFPAIIGLVLLLLSLVGVQF